MVMRIKLKVLMILLISIIFSASTIGCLNPTSLEKYGYVLTVGVDKGKEKKYEITFELQRELSGEEGSENPGRVVLLSEEGDTIFEAINILYRRTSFDLNFARTHAFVFCKELAKSGRMKDFFSMSLDKLRIRQSAIVLIADGTAKEFLGGRNANNEANATRLHENLLEGEGMVGETSIMNLGAIFESCDGRRFDVALTYGSVDDKIITDAKQKESASMGENPVQNPKDKVGGMQTQMEGAALFDGWKLVGTLSGHDTQILNIASGRFKNGSIAMDDSKEVQYALLVQLDESRVKIEIADKVKAEISVVLSLTIEQDPTGELGRNWEDKGKKLVEEYFEKELDRIAKYCKKVNSDAMGIGRYVSKKFNTIEEWEAFDWKKMYPETEIKFNVDVILSDVYIAITRQ